MTKIDNEIFDTLSGNFQKNKTHHSIKKSVLLLESEPGLLGRCLGHGFCAAESVIGSSGQPLVGVDLTHHQDVGQLVEGVGKDANGFQHAVGVVSLGLARRGAVIVPVGQILGLGQGARGVFHLQGSGLVAQGLASTVDPDIARLVVLALIQVQVVLKGLGRSFESFKTFFEKSLPSYSSLEFVISFRKKVN